MPQSALPGLFQNEPPRRIAVLRALVLGDMLCATPALRALRRAAPQSEIILIGLPWARTFADRFRQYIDDFWEFPGFPGLPEIPFNARQFPEFLARAQRARLDLAIQLHGSGEIMNLVALLLGARQTAGFYRPGQSLPDTQWFLPYPETGSEIERNLNLIEHLGVPLAGDHLDFPLYGEDFEELAALPEAKRLRRGGYVCLHPGARYSSRRWPVERFAQVGDALSRRGLEVVITGSANEIELADSLSRSMSMPHTNLAGPTTIGFLGALFDGARLLVCNDTGVSHMAAALRVPSVVIVTGSDPDRWAPLDRARHRIVRHSVPCQPCVHVHCPIDHPCATGIEVSAVERVCIEMLERWKREGSTRLRQPKSPARHSASQSRDRRTGLLPRAGRNGPSPEFISHRSFSGRFDTDFFSERFRGVTASGPQ